MSVLSPADLRELEAHKGIDVVIGKINLVSKEIAKKSFKSTAEKKTADFINGFCDFAWKTSAIVSTLLPQSPEYTVTFGVMMLIFKVGLSARTVLSELTQSLDCGYEKRKGGDSRGIH